MVTFGVLDKPMGMIVVYIYMSMAARHLLNHNDLHGAVFPEINMPEYRLIIATELIFWKQNQLVLFQLDAEGNNL